MSIVVPIFIRVHNPFCLSSNPDSYVKVSRKNGVIFQKKPDINFHLIDSLRKPVVNVFLFNETSIIKR